MERVLSLLATAALTAALSTILTAALAAALTASARVFDVALPVPDQSADIQFIVDDAGAAL
jgi:hypothetical protein